MRHYIGMGEYLPEQLWLFFNDEGQYGGRNYHYVSWCPSRRRAQETVKEWGEKGYPVTWLEPPLLYVPGTLVKDWGVLERIWVLIDMGNGDSRTYRYLWWFRTRQEAREHLKRRRDNPRYASLAGPFSLVQSRALLPRPEDEQKGKTPIIRNARGRLGL